MQDGIDAVVAYLRRRNPELGPLDPAQDLIDSRILDSLAIVEFVLLIEELTGAEIDMDTVTRNDLRTLQAIERRFFTAGTGQATR
ncbi:acyl carrier protein [Micromonospora orduensis]|uniref:Acyl carrier protein n=1 Tax=Micromonospora orduensis TaxID=1420891 RepID=A0A5C4QUJ0_9ACTN|nr:phosphopantetheine-binding protein [Micromonospora orduensis]TNH29628.1 acyl carrier protein [Micromonospora orduensis]